MAKDKLIEDLSVPETPGADTKKDKAPAMTPELFDTINSQNMGDGTFLFDEEPTDGEKNAEPSVEYKPKSGIEMTGPYSDEMFADIMKNPSKFFFVSKKHGKMNLKDAIDKGYNPDTDEFDKPKRKSKEELTEGLSDSDRESINKITDPANAKVPPKDAEKYDIKDDRFIAKPEGQMLPEEVAAPTAAPAVEGEATPEGEANGNEDIMALLSGGKA